MTVKLLIAAMIIIAVLNFAAFFQTESAFSLVIAIFLLVLSVLFMYQLRRQ